MAEDGVYRHVQVRSRGCNESFRAAVDRSYEAPHNPMEPGMLKNDHLTRLVSHRGSREHQTNPLSASGFSSRRRRMPFSAPAVFVEFAAGL